MTNTNTYSAGTWLLSYLCELGLINNHLTVECGCVLGEVLKEFLNIKKGSLIYIKIDKKDKTLFHVKHYLDIKPENLDDDDWDEHPDNILNRECGWWKNEEVQSMSFRLGLIKM